MTTPSGRLPAAGWAGQPERSNLRLLRAMRTIALGAGRTVSRLLLHPIVAYFLLTGHETRRQSARYLERALGRPARWRDVYRHLHTFASTLLDRVYLLQGQFDRFEVEASGVETIMQPFARGDGVLAFGAHLGSFEALHLVGRDKGLRIAMVMVEEHSRLINETLRAIAPDAELHTIGLGRVDAMLALSKWLDDGGVAGMLADRTLPGPSNRSRSHRIAFLGAPALFADGPFRLAAMLRRKVVFMAGLHGGGNRYALRFAELADFTSIAPGGRDAAIRAGLERYVATLETLCRESPYNWFNFYDFWADEDAALSEPTV